MCWSTRPLEGVGLRPKSSFAQEGQRLVSSFFRHFSISNFRHSNVSLRDVTLELSLKRNVVQPPCHDAVSERACPFGVDLTETEHRWKGKVVRFSVGAFVRDVDITGAFTWNTVFTIIFWFFLPSTRGCRAAGFVGTLIDFARARRTFVRAWVPNLLWFFAVTWDVFLVEYHNQLGTLASGSIGAPKHSLSGGNVSTRTSA